MLSKPMEVFSLEIFAICPFFLSYLGVIKSFLEFLRKPFWVSESNAKYFFEHCAAFKDLKYFQFCYLLGFPPVYLQIQIVPIWITVLSWLAVAVRMVELDSGRSQDGHDLTFVSQLLIDYDIGKAKEKYFAEYFCHKVPNTFLHDLEIPSPIPIFNCQRYTGHL